MATELEWITTSGFLRALDDFANETVWRGFVDRFRPAIRGYARRMGIPEADLEDFAQDVLFAFVTAYGAGRYDRGLGGLRSWLFTIAHKKVVDAHRARQRLANRLDHRLDTEEPALQESERLWETQWRQYVVHRMLEVARGDFGERTWQAFHEVVIRERDPEEVARSLRMSRNAVYIAKYRVLRRLGEIMRDAEAGDG